MPSHTEIGEFIWRIADHLRGDYEKNDNEDVILPFTLLRRLDCVLEKTRDKVRETEAQVAGKVTDDVLKKLLIGAATVPFYNRSKFSFAELLKDAANIKENFGTYLEGFSDNIKEILYNFSGGEEKGLAPIYETLARKNLLYLITKEFASEKLDLHPDVVTNHEMGLIYEYLIRKFKEGAAAGEQYTPRDVVQLLVQLVFADVEATLKKSKGTLVAIYDPAVGTGGMVTVAKEYLTTEWNLDPTNVFIYGQELREKTYAICKADALMKGDDGSRIKQGNTLSNDQLSGQQFNFMMANPEFGTDWKKIEDTIRKEAALGTDGRFSAGLPDVGDASFLFLQHMISKMTPVEKLAEEEEKARTKLKEARAKVRRLEEELRELRPERRLFRFIEQRAQAQDYRAHLGLVSLVRRDFHELSRLFAETEAEAQSQATLSDEERAERKKMGASIDRIVLFVDDLDRCQPDKVVDVLQAVHLLLAYPLFAVVVGVDQRCLKQSIEKQFVGLVSLGDGAQDGERPATSLDYLEKIFHVPFHLPQMGEQGFSTLIHNLTEPPLASETQDSDLGMQDNQLGKQTDTLNDPDKTEAAKGSPNDETKKDPPVGADAHTSAENGSHSRVIGSVPLFRWERTALKDYHPLIRTPRAATRLLNTYRLVRAGIPAEEWDLFRGDEAMHGEFRVAMLLLASAAGYPAVARDWFATLRHADSTALVMDDPQRGADKDWAQFHKVYSAIFEQTTTQPTKELFAKWLDRVERFAF